MVAKWKILLYSTEQGNSPVKDFILGLDFKTQSKIRNTLNLLQDFGTSLSSPHVKKLVGSQLWELRILGTDNIRIFYITISQKTFLLLHGFKKKSNKTPLKEIKVAEARLAEHRSRT